MHRLLGGASSTHFDNLGFKVAHVADRESQNTRNYHATADDRLMLMNGSCLQDHRLRSHHDRRVNRLRAPLALHPQDTANENSQDADQNCLRHSSSNSCRRRLKEDGLKSDR